MKMLLSYEQCINKYKSDYQIKKQIKEGKLYRIERGVYSDQKYESELSVIRMKYPSAVLGLYSAFFYQGLTDTIPRKYYLVTNRNDAKIKDQRVKQSFEKEEYLTVGVEEKLYNNTKIKIYNKERLLVDLIRFRNKLPFDYYKEIINNYRKIIHDLDIVKIQEYIYMLPKTNITLEVLEKEVF